MTMTAKREYRRRSDEERIAELEARIEAVKQRMLHKDRPDEAVLNQIPKLQRNLRKFAQLAMSHGRSDLANSTLAFLAGLDRMRDNGFEGAPPRRGRGADSAVRSEDEDE
jgi:hypothetical protein